MQFKPLFTFLTGLAAHKSIDEARVVALAEVLPAGW